MLGSASEDFLMPHKDRVRIVEIVSEHVDGRLPLIVGCGDPILRRTLQYFDDTAGMKIDAYHLLPTDGRMTARLAYSYCKTIADRAPKPIWLYNNSARGLKIPIDVVAELKEHPNIVGTKAGSFDLKDIVPFCMMDCETFQTVGAGGSHLPVFLGMGCDAHTASPACCFPRQFCEAFDLRQTGRHEESRRTIFAVSHLLKALIPDRINSELCAEEKAVLEILGICGRHVLAPFVPCTDEQVEQKRRILADAGILPAEVA